MSGSRWYCEDVMSLPPCCGSCHEDAELGYDMIEGRYGNVCCRVWDVAKAHGLNVNKPLPTGWRPL